jgi:hypothetical protein
MNTIRNAFLTTLITATVLMTPAAHAGRPHRPAPTHHRPAAHSIVPFAVGLGVGLLTAPFVVPAPPPPPQVIVAPPPVTVVRQGRWVEREERVWIEGTWTEGYDAYGRRCQTWTPGYWATQRTRVWVDY